MATNESKEDYLERFLMLKTEGYEKIRAVDLANSLGYSPASVSIALKKLENEGYVLLGEHDLLSLTEKGNEIASKVYERHKILGSFFISLGVSKKTAYLDACKVEHDISEETFNALKKDYESRLLKK